MDTLWNGEAMVHLMEVSEPVIHHTAAILIISLLSVIGAWAIRIWRDRRYGVFVRIVSAWVEDPQPGAYPSFQYKTLWQGRALDLFHRHSVTRTFVTAFRRIEDGLFDARSWKAETAKQVLEIVDNQISMQFAAGSLAKAVRDKDVTTGEFYLGAFRVEAGALMLLMRPEDVCKAIEARGAGPFEELKSARRMFDALEHQEGEFLDRIVLYS